MSEHDHQPVQQDVFDGELHLGSDGFHDLMRRRVGEILLVSSLYDSFILEEDGQLGDRILADYVDLHLRYAPRVTRVSTGRKALGLMRYRRFDLVITMTRLPDMDVGDFCREVKRRYLGTPLVVLAYDSIDLPWVLERFDRAATDHLLVWSGDSRLLLAAIKLVEDRWNVDHDTRQGMVRTLLVVEDSVRRLCSFLPTIYTELMTQTRKVMSEGLNYMDKLLRMRARPKILLARDYEEGMTLFERYADTMMAVISDVRFPRKGELCDDAGFTFLTAIRRRSPDLPVVLHSSDPANQERATEMGSYFLDKNSPTWLQDLQHFFTTHLGFGDFVFRLPDGTEVGRASSVREMEEMIHQVPDESVVYHLSRHHLATWALARGENSLAAAFRQRKLAEFVNLRDAREFVSESLRQLRIDRRRGVVSDFTRTSVDPTMPFVRLGGGSLGGKGRGIAFLAALLARLDLDRKFPAVHIAVPQTVAIGTDVFSQFLEDNHLEKAAVRSDDDAEIGDAFRAGELRPELVEDLRAYLSKVTYPLAVRSSSLLEDSLYQPFAGLYATYMIPNNDPDPDVRLRQLCNAIKLVYASTFYQAPKSYICSTSFRLEEERMGIVIQRLVANRHGDVCYPNFSGVVTSWNFYPLGRLKAEQGLAQVALGLGKTVVDGGNVLRFSPAKPRILPQFATIRDMLRNSQREFYALDLSRPGVGLCRGGDGPLIKLGLEDAERHGTLAPVGSVYVREDGVVRDGIFHEGPRLVTFAHILQYDQFPLAAILAELTNVGRRAMGMEVEMEFAVNLHSPDSEKHEFAVLQCRPLATTGQHAAVHVDESDRDRALVYTEQCLGNGRIDDLVDVVYVAPDRWDASRTVEIAREVGRINERLAAEDRRYILVGIGRWGTADHWLGIPVAWNEISGARVMVEVGTRDFHVEPSQGSHFFHNITAFHIGYMTVQEGSASSFIDWDALRSAEVVSELEYVRHIRFDEAVQVLLDARHGRGVILEPGSGERLDAGDLSLDGER